MNRSIIIMTKVPRAGNVKTRLQPYLAPAECGTLAEAFLADAISKARHVCDCLIVAFAPENEKKYFDKFAAENLTLVAQRGADLGEKMFQAFEFAFDLDSNANALIIGTDSPTFPVEFIEKSFEFLESNAETVLGATDDGGFYLLGLRENHSPIFENVEWSSPQVFAQTTRNIEHLKLSLKLVPAWYDLDAPEDLRRLRAEFLQSEPARKLAPQTYRWLLERSAEFDLNSSFRFSNSENKF